MMEGTVESIPEGVKLFSRLIDRLVTGPCGSVWPRLKTCAETGRFGRKVEGAGKLRIFAIASPIFQTLIRPLHEWAMSVLKTLKTDGTYDQLAPLRRLKGKKVLYSFDLKSATDLLPSLISTALLRSLFGEDLAFFLVRYYVQDYVQIPRKIAFCRARETT